MIVLAADTSTATNTVALTEDGHILAESVVHAGRRHSERLLENVEWLLTESGRTLTRVDYLAISSGPGSFTGLRVGVATWKGLASGAGLPLVAVPTLDAMSLLSPPWTGDLCVLLDARMNEVFGAVYRFEAGRRETVKEPAVGPVTDFLDDLPAGTLFLGDGAALYQKAILEGVPEGWFAAPHNSIPRASAVAAEAVELVLGGASTKAEHATPIYLRKPKADKPKARDDVSGASRP